ncbi:unnamed protein product, partial [Urochloa humidicola]
GGEARISADEAAPGTEQVTVGSGGGSRRASGPPGGVRRQGEEAAGDSDGVPEPPGVRDDAEACGGTSLDSTIAVVASPSPVPPSATSPTSSAACACIDH